MSDLYFDDSEMQEALEILIAKGITPTDYERAWKIYQAEKVADHEHK